MIDHDQFYEEFIDYQALRDNDFPVEAFDDANAIEGRVDEEEVYHYRIDTMWFHINEMKIAGTKIKHFKLLPKVAEVVLVLPHSNADLKKLFSIVRKNSTDVRCF